jgi:hypothetical protein
MSTTTPDQKTSKKDDKFKVLAKMLRLDPNNERIDLGDIESLASQIELSGVLSPLTGYKEKEGEDTVFYAKDGCRRFHAIQLLIERGKADDLWVPFVLEKKGTNLEQSIVNRWILNDGKPFTVFEKCTSVGKLVAFGWELPEIAKRLGITAQWANKLYTLYCGPKELQNLVISKRISGTLAIEKIETGDPYVFIADVKAGKYDEKPMPESQLSIEDHMGTNPPLQPKQKKITAKTLSGGINSYKSFKKWAASPVVIPDRMPAHKREQYQLLLKIINDQVDDSFFTKYFMED